MLFSGLSVKDGEESVVAASSPAPAAPVSLLGQGADLMEDVQLELPVRKPQTVNMMDLDAMSTLPAPGDEKKKGKKKHKKEHKEHRSKKSSSSSSSSSSAATAVSDPNKVVRKRVQRSNVTRPGYGREEDHVVPVDDIHPTDTEVRFSCFWKHGFKCCHCFRALNPSLGTTRKKSQRRRRVLAATLC
jgi:hypothetical protein